MTEAVALWASRKKTEGLGSAKCTRALCTPCTLMMVRAQFGFEHRLIARALHQGAIAECRIF